MGSQGETTSPLSSEQEPTFSDQNLEESLASLYKPPYSIRNRQGIGVPDEREETQFQQAAPQKENPLFQPYGKPEPKETSRVQQPIESEEDEVTTRGGTILPLLLLMIGSHLLILGLLLLFCSKNGIVTLEWSSRFWGFYLLLGAPMLYLGGRILKRNF